jgi:hypothetical protein
VTKSIEIFNQALKEAEALLFCFDELNSAGAVKPPEVLKKASLILVLTAWETYVEDLASELLELKFSALTGSLSGRFIENQFKDRLKQFHNPDSRKTKQLFEEFFDIDITEKWEWNNVSPKEARTQLNNWISKRGDAVHRYLDEENKPIVIRKEDLLKCFRFFNELVRATDSAVENK